MSPVVIRLQEDVYAELVKLKAAEEGRTGKRLTMNDAVKLAMNGKVGNKPSLNRA